MTPGRNRARVNVGKRGLDDYGVWSSDELPDPPENPEFLEYPQEFQDLVDARISAGIAKGAINEAYARAGVRIASRDCAQRFRDAALHRATKGITTMREAFEQGRVTVAKRRERRNGGAR